MRCEFRTRAQEHSWRLLLLSPLGDDQLRNESIQKYGGFICGIIDISPTKARELAEKNAAKDALKEKTSKNDLSI